MTGAIVKERRETNWRSGREKKVTSRHFAFHFPVLDNTSSEVMELVHPPPLHPLENCVFGLCQLVRSGDFNSLSDSAAVIKAKREMTWI